MLRKGSLTGLLLFGILLGRSILKGISMRFHEKLLLGLPSFIW